MRYLSLCLTVTLAGGMPLAALATDYGAGSPMLATDANAPQLPGAGATSHGDASRPDSAASEAPSTPDAEDPVRAAAPQRVAPSTTQPAPRGGTANAAAPHVAAPASAPTPATASWQSLLPGSIQ